MGTPALRVRTRLRRIVAATTAGVLATVGLVTIPSAPAVAAVPAGFSDTVAISGLSSPTATAFAPDGRVFVAEKSGIVKVFDSLADPTATVFADLRTQTQDFWDRGLLGLAVDPQFPARPYVYASYTYDAEPGGTAPRWGDACPTPPGATDKGCVVTGRVSKLTMGAGGTATAEQPLLTGWCQQYPSHSIGTVTFGPDGNLYVGGGDGASFNFADYGQVGNPCADPPGAQGTNLSPPAAEGGALRSQSPRRAAGQPVLLNGAILRIDPDTGEGVAGNPFASSADANARRIIAYGLRNQFRFGFRPGGNELWAGDVGWGTWEEINRVADVTDAVAENFGWPCYEGDARQSGYDNANLTRCESLYSGPGQTAPYHAYNHSAKVAAGDGCPTGGSSVSGIAFESGSNYPPAYDGALFFADSSRGCIWAMQSDGGEPSPSRIVPFVTGANVPVQVLTGPGGDLFYVALGAGELRRVTYWDGSNRPPVAAATANPSSGPAPLTVQFDGSGSSDPDPGDTLTYAWDLDGDGAHDDATGPIPTWTYVDTATVGAGLRVTDSNGAGATTGVSVTVGTPQGLDPVPVIDEPTSALKWRVGQTVAFTGRAVDAQDGTLPAAALSWRLAIRHCATNGTCHTHNVQDYTGVSSGTFVAPDHEYPSHLELTLTAKDSSGRTGTRTLELHPQTVQLNFTSNPSGALLTVAGSEQRAPFSRTVIVGSNNSISAASPQRLGSFNSKYAFTSWSDGGARTHNITAQAAATEYRANYRWCWLLNPC
ncbi:Glucose/arabinose dehydrogenase, beta-propeller fold [Amycolatopsis marina]|uniref:Glucose/arabinose dehydrogenase, beta-propeller fold n=1 Tax=Amycolatopsis marina TaxID=490629 RepID=A0A1I1A973_9PSEU|nr:PQQ-dependent sugar dehydrogenase [Amycolatopsis marina]SFB32973.1 Glucose/arabinose dehydrogenase, beta-propeller fold [Amycolatopsis marina]